MEKVFLANYLFDDVVGIRSAHGFQNYIVTIPAKIGHWRWGSDFDFEIVFGFEQPSGITGDRLNRTKAPFRTAFGK